MNDKEFNKYLGIANHDIQVANNHEELKSYVASILYELDNLQSNWNSLREYIINVIDGAREELNTIMQGENLEYINQCSREFEVIRKNLEFILDKMNELEESDNK